MTSNGSNEISFVDGRLTIPETNRKRQYCISGHKQSAQVVRIALPVVCDAWFASGSDSSDLETHSKNWLLKTKTEAKRKQKKQGVGKGINQK